jgi:hypothetical protein
MPDKSSIVFKRGARERVQVTAHFEFRSARYDVLGTIDLARHHVEPFTHRLSVNGQRVFDLSVAHGDSSVRSEFTFGDATRGARRAMLTTEPLGSGTLTTGTVDGRELLPVRSTGCSCKSTDRPRPVLAWNDDGSVRPLELSFKSAKAAGDLQGLAEVVETTIARANDGPFGDIVDCITLALCLLMCALETLWCLIGSMGKPRPDIFAGLCITISGACPGLCKFEHTFP